MLVNGDGKRKSRLQDTRCQSKGQKPVSIDIHGTFTASLVLIVPFLCLQNIFGNQ